MFNPVVNNFYLKSFDRVSNTCLSKLMSVAAASV